VLGMRYGDELMSLKAHVNGTTKGRQTLNQYVDWHMTQDCKKMWVHFLLLVSSPLFRHHRKKRPKMAPQLSVWEGESLSRAGDATKWVNTFLVFHPDTSIEGKYQVEGRGLSIWRDKRIVFIVSGEIELPSSRNGRRGLFRLVKQHTGQYTNKIEYSGSVGVDIMENGMTLDGDYASGELHLKRTGGREEFLSGLLSGAWTGETISRSDTTVWSELAIRFSPIDEQTDTKMLLREGGEGGGDSSNLNGDLMVITGSGVSQWRSKNIPFNLKGLCNLATKELRLMKIHTGAVNTFLCVSLLFSLFTCWFFSLSHFLFFSFSFFLFLSITSIDFSFSTLIK
jgi:hypothetical protein